MDLKRLFNSQSKHCSSNLFEKDTFKIFLVKYDL